MTCEGCLNPYGGIFIAGCRCADNFRRILSYDPYSGEFVWNAEARKADGGRGMKRGGMKAGCVAGTGYLVIHILGRQYKAHRVAWLMHYGAWPQGLIDHKNRNRLDNRIENLRDATYEINAENRSKPIASRNPLPGVKAHPRSGHFSAKVVTRGRCTYLGTFHTAEAAHEAYLAAKRALHVGFTS